MKRRSTEKGSAKDAVKAFRAAINEEDIPSDVQGSYTGTGERGSHPVQDADDL